MAEEKAVLSAEDKGQDWPKEPQQQKARLKRISQSRAAQLQVCPCSCVGTGILADHGEAVKTTDISQSPRGDPGCLGRHGLKLQMLSVPGFAGSGGQRTVGPGGAGEGSQGAGAGGCPHRHHCRRYRCCSWTSVMPCTQHC